MSYPHSRGNTIGSNSPMPGTGSPTVTLQMTASDTTDPGLLIITNPNAPGTQLLMLLEDPNGNPIFQVPQSGGPQFFGVRAGATEFYSDYGVGLDGTQNPPCIYFPDGTSNGLRVWGGTGAPTSSTVGVCAVGDWYLRRDTPSTANQRLYICTVASTGIGNAGTWVGFA